MEKKRILVTISFSFSIRYLYRSGLLHAIQQFAHPVIAITWNQADFIEELRAAGFEVHLIPESQWTTSYGVLRHNIDAWFYTYHTQTRSRNIQNKYLRNFLPFTQRIKKAAREKFDSIQMRLPGKGAKLFALEEAMYKNETNYNEMVELVQRLNVEAVFTLTPFHKQEDVLLRACKDAGKKMITSILSFDNVTKRGWLPVAYDVYMVWNKHNHRELLSIYPNLAQSARIVVTGAAQFDFYYNQSYLQSKAEWSRQVGIDAANRKIILYAGGPKQLLPQEPMFLKDIDEAISAGKIPGKPIILFRCHPIDKIERWKAAIGPSQNIIYETSWSGSGRLQNANLSDTDIVKLCSNLAHTDVHINVCSTMTVDGSAFNKPQIGPGYDNENKRQGRLLRTMYQQDHFVPIMKSNGLQLARSKHELIKLVNDALANPQNYVQQCDKVLKEIITYTDGKCANRVATVLKEALHAV